MMIDSCPLYFRPLLFISVLFISVPGIHIPHVLMGMDSEVLGDAETALIGGLP